jgi:hypothetical protein
MTLNLNAPPTEIHERRALTCPITYSGVKSTEMHKMTVEYVKYLSHRKVYK